MDCSWEAGITDPSFVLHLENPPHEIAHIMLPQRNRKAPSSITLNDKRVSAAFQVKVAGSFSVRAQY